MNALSIMPKNKTSIYDDLCKLISQLVSRALFSFAANQVGKRCENDECLREASEILKRIVEKVGELPPEYLHRRELGICMLKNLKKINREIDVPDFLRSKEDCCKIVGRLHQESDVFEQFSIDLEFEASVLDADSKTNAPAISSPLRQKNVIARRMVVQCWLEDLKTLKLIAPGIKNSNDVKPRHLIKAFKKAFKDDRFDELKVSENTMKDDLEEVRDNAVDFQHKLDAVPPSKKNSVIAAYRLGPIIDSE